MKIALAQMDVLAGQIEKNLATMRRMISQAKGEGADLVVFPEMCTHGYLVGDKWLLDDFCRSANDIAAEMQTLSQGIAIAWGSVFLDETLSTRLQRDGYYPAKDGRTRRYNAIYVVQNGEMVSRPAVDPLLPAGIQPKTLLPNYRIFDDQRYFFSLNDIAKDVGTPLPQLIQPFNIKDKRGVATSILFQVCEDMWAEDYRENGRALNITKMGIDNGAEIVINLSASPWTYGKNDARDRRVKFLHEQSGSDTKPFLYVNCVGVQNNGKNFVTFDGGSTVYNAQGEATQLAQEPYNETLMMVDTDVLCDPEKQGDLRKQDRPKKPLIAEKYDAIIRGIRALKDVRGGDELPRFVIGLSGGVDSAVVCALLVKALGANRVVAVNMPSKFNSEATKGAAAAVASALGVAYYQVPISDMVGAVEASLRDHFFAQVGRDLKGLAKENVQAKIRGTDVLSNIAGNENWLFTNNGNKLEIALGYATLYGDVGGSIAPIGDLLKTEVFEMGRYLNQSVFCREVIPESLLPDALCQFSEDQIKPSAELEHDQEDPMKFGYHDALLALIANYQKWSEEQVIVAYQAGTLHREIGQALGGDAQFGLALMQRWQVDLAENFVQDLRWFFSTIDKNVFKRVQAPGIVITSKSAFGYDIRESMLPYYESPRLIELRGKVVDYIAR